MSLIIANWKMNLTLKAAHEFCFQLSELNKIENLVIAPPIPYLGYLASNFPKICFASSDISIYSGFGSYTGEYSGKILKSCGVKYVICGHAERREFCNESNEIIKQKFHNILEADLVPIICVGENAKISDNKVRKALIKTQLDSIFTQNYDTKASTIIIAYEPVWSIGSGLNPSLNELEEIFSDIKEYINNAAIVNNTQLLYGGSVTLDNFNHIVNIQNINGLLIGTTSLSCENLKQILK